jgi:hypothetical protein
MAFAGSVDPTSPIGFNPLLVATGAGKALLSCADSVVSMLSEQKKTDLLRTENYRGKIFLEALAKTNEVQAGCDVNSYEEMTNVEYHINRLSAIHETDELLRKIRNEFNLAEERLRIESEENTKKFANRTLADKNLDEWKHELRTNLYDIITFSKAILDYLKEESDKNQKLIAELEEERRKAYDSYSKAFRNAI